MYIAGSQSQPATFRWSNFYQVFCFFVGVGVGGEMPLAFPRLARFLPAHPRARTQMVLGILALVIGYAFSALSAHFLLPVGALVMLLYGVQAHKQALEQISPSFVEAVSAEHVGD
jgi:MFS family permease